MFPREHGAYGQALFALATALMIGRPGAAAFTLAMTVGLAAVIFSRREHSAAGELVAAATFASLAYPVARAGGASSHASLTCAMAFAAIFIPSTLCVRAVIEHARRPPAWAARVSGAVVALGSIGILRWMSEAGLLSGIATVGALPACVAVALVALLAPGSRHLRKIGWMLLAMTLLGAMALTAALG